jgi:hypothetical protein
MPTIQQVHYTGPLSEGCREICEIFMLSYSLVRVLLQTYVSKKHPVYNSIRMCADNFKLQLQTYLMSVYRDSAAVHFSNTQRTVAE